MAVEPAPTPDQLHLCPEGPCYSVEVQAILAAQSIGGRVRRHIRWTHYPEPHWHVVPPGPKPDPRQLRIL